jgi:hypothetical protein
MVQNLRSRRRLMRNVAHTADTSTTHVNILSLNQRWPQHWEGSLPSAHAKLRMVECWVEGFCIRPGNGVALQNQPASTSYGTLRLEDNYGT